jgi:hypothetical protein
VFVITGVIALGCDNRFFVIGFSRHRPSSRFVSGSYLSMAKRARSPVREQPAKRHCGARIEDCLPRETLLGILSQLDPADLVAVERCSRRFARLANDGLVSILRGYKGGGRADTEWRVKLWKQLFLTHFASRARSLLDAPDHESCDYKQLFKIAHNWRRGYAKSSAVELRSSVLDGRMPVEVALSSDSPSSPPSSPSSSLQQRDTLVQFHNRFIFTASRTSSSPRFPAVHAFVDEIDGRSRSIAVLSSPTLVSYYEARPHLLNREGLRVTELRLDEARLPDGAKRLAVFYSSGQFAIFRFVAGNTSPSSLEWEEEYARVELPSLAPGDPADGVVLSRFHSPLLVTCSKDFLLGVWLISTEGDDSEEGKGKRTRVQLTQPSLRSSVCWWPVVLSLAADPPGMWDTTESFKVTIAYSTPFFPSSWTVGVQEFLVRLYRDSDEGPSSSLGKKNNAPPRVRIVTRHATAVPTTQFSSFGSRRAGSGREAAVVTSIEHSSPWIVTSRSDNTIEVFRIVSDTSSIPCSSPPSRSPLKTPSRTAAAGRRRGDERETFGVRYHSTLYGHTAAVESVSLGEGGRCVSGGADGKVKVWQLRRRSAGDRGDDWSGGEADEEEEEDEEEGTLDEVDVVVAESSETEQDTEDGGQPRRIKWLGFDQRRIVSVVGGGASEGVRVLSFE